MNLIVPINLQAVRATRYDCSLFTPNSEHFSGPTTAFDQLPWRDSGWNMKPDSKGRANLSSFINKPLVDPHSESLTAGVHLHWALPDALTKGTQHPDGPVEFPAAPDRWLVTRLLNQAGRIQVKQWIVESNYLMLEHDYSRMEGGIEHGYSPETGRKCISIPVGWGASPTSEHPPFRRLGKVFELSRWRPQPRTEKTDPLKAVGPSGPTFAAYYPDSSSVFGFQDNFKDLDAGSPNESFLDEVAFTVSYYVTGWHSDPESDPLCSPAFKAALTEATKCNAGLPADRQSTSRALYAQTVRDEYHWYYDKKQEPPERSLYNAKIAALPWDATKKNQTYMTPPPKDDSTRIAIGNSTSEALAALIRNEWKTRVEADGSSNGKDAPKITPEMEQKVEYLLDALQSGLLHRVGKSLSLPQLEQSLHKQGFGSYSGGGLWVIRQKQSAYGADTGAPQATLPDNQDRLPEKLHALNTTQQRLDALLTVIKSIQRQIFLDWYKYMSALFPNPDEKAPIFAENKTELTDYLSAQILDLWTKLEAAFGMKTAGDPKGDPIPVFHTGAIRFDDKKSGRYSCDSPGDSLAGMIVSRANRLLDLLEKEEYTNFELQHGSDSRYWEPHEPVIVVTADSLQPARRNGATKHLPCRLTSDLLTRLSTVAGGVKAAVSGKEVCEFLTLKAPDLPGADTDEGAAAKPICADLPAILADACLLDPNLVSTLADKLSISQPDIPNLDAAIKKYISKIQTAWRQIAPRDARSPLPDILSNVTITAESLHVAWAGTAPQGLGVTFQADAWVEPFLPLFLVWEAAYTPFEKNPIAKNSGEYTPGFIKKQFQLDEELIDLVFNNTSSPREVAGSVTIRGGIPLSSKASHPLIDQIRDYLDHYPDKNVDENLDLQKIITHFQNKPLLSQGLNGINASAITRRIGLQLTPFNPFYDNEIPPERLGAKSDSMVYTNSLTHFIGRSVGAQIDQTPRSADNAYNLIRGGRLELNRLVIVDVFGRKKHIFNRRDPNDAKKIIPSWRLAPGVHDNPVDRKMHHVHLPPRLAQAARLRFNWLSAKNEDLKMNSHPATSPICGWVLPNHLDNSLAFYSASGQALGSLGVFGGRKNVSWQSVPGAPPQDMETDLGKANSHLVKFAAFVHGEKAPNNRAFFKDLMDSIENAHTYILPDDKQTAQAQAVLMGRPLAIVRAGLRFEVRGLPAFNTGNSALKKDLNFSTQDYDWTKRDYADVLNIHFPVRLGDRNHLEDGLVAYFLDSQGPYDCIYAPAAPGSGDARVVQPSADTLTLTLRPSIDPPAAPYTSDADQIKDLRNPARNADAKVTLLMDPRAKLHAAMGILPVKAIELPPDQYAQAIKSIAISFFTHPILRTSKDFDLPIPSEPGYEWLWTTSVKTADAETPQNEALQARQRGDRAFFSYSPLILQDGWLKLEPRHEKKQKNVNG